MQQSQECVLPDLDIVNAIYRPAVLLICLLTVCLSILPPISPAKGALHTPGLPEAALVQEALAAHLAGELLSVAVQQVLKLHVCGGRGPAGGLLVLHLAHRVGKGQRLGGVVVLWAQLLGPRLHLSHHILVIAAHLLPGGQGGQVRAVVFFNLCATAH